MIVENWTNADLDPAEQFSALRDVMLTGPLPMTLERPGTPSRTPIHADFTIRSFGEAAMMTALSGGALGLRGKSEIARSSADFVYLLQPNAEAWYVVDGVHYPVRPRDLLLVDGETSTLGGGAETVEFCLWRLPRPIVQPLLAQPAERLGAWINGESPGGRLINSYLGELVPALEVADAAGRHTLLEGIGRLIAVERGIARHSLELGRQAVESGKLAQIREVVEQKIYDPDLSPDTVARAVGISMRRLHLLFEPTGTSFGRYVNRQRLKRCSTALQDPALRHCSITDIAFSHGFASLATFYRAFRAQYGCAPNDMRERFRSALL